MFESCTYLLLSWALAHATAGSTLGIRVTSQQAESHGTCANGPGVCSPGSNPISPWGSRVTGRRPVTFGHTICLLRAVFAGLHGPVPCGLPLAGVGLTDSGAENSRDPPPDVQGGSRDNPSAAPVLSNLLNTLQTWKSGDIQKKGILIGAGLPPIPANLSERILKWEYVEMAGLIPYIWSLPWSTGQPAKPCRQVRDIGMWLQCFASYIAVLSTNFPRTSPVYWPIWSPSWGLVKSLKAPAGPRMIPRTGSRWQLQATGTGHSQMVHCSRSVSQPEPDLWSVVNFA